MLGWIFSLCSLIVGLKNHNEVLIIVSGLYAIAGSVGFGLMSLRPNSSKDATN